MAEQKKFEHWGIFINKIVIQGVVVEDPVITKHGENDIAIMQVYTRIRAADHNGQFVDMEQTLPVYVMDPNKVEKVVRPYITKGRKLHIEGYLRIWDQGFGVITSNIILGDKPYAPKDDSTENSPGPALPPG